MIRISTHNLKKAKRIKGDLSLRDEIRLLLNGDEFGEAIGHWIILRTQDSKEYNENFDHINKEPIDGPAHPYTDKPVKCFSVVNQRISTFKETEFPFGQLSMYQAIYFFEYIEDSTNPYYVRPKVHDIIFEVDYKKEKPPTIEGNVLKSGSEIIYYDKDFITQYQIEQALTLRLDDHGRGEYIIVGVSEKAGPPSVN